MFYGMFFANIKMAIITLTDIVIATIINDMSQCMET